VTYGKRNQKEKLVEMSMHLKRIKQQNVPFVLNSTGIVTCSVLNNLFLIIEIKLK